ncbi:MAG: hypothetical protein ABW189_08100 [Rickettsiales bacterium]
MTAKRWTRSPSYNLQPAAKIITLLGGRETVAGILGVDQGTVLRWTHPKTFPLKGTGGKIPQHHAEKLLSHAKENYIGLKAEDFFAI